MRKIHFFGSALACIAALTASVSLAQQSWQAPTGKDFPLAGGNLANQRYSALARITPQNVRTLGGAWMIHVAAEGQTPGNLPGTPVVVDGVMYIGASGGDVLAVNAATGAIIWRYKSTFGAQSNRGV